MHRFGRFSFVAALVVTASTSCGRNSQAYVTRAKSLYTQGKYQDASLNARKAIQANPRSGEAYYWLGVSETKLEHARESYDALLRSVDLLPQQDEPKIKLAELVLQAYLLDRNRPAQFYQQATQLADQLLARNPGNYDALVVKSYLALSDHHPAD